MELIRSVAIILSVILSVNNVSALGPTRAKRQRLASYWLPEARELKMALGIDEDIYLNFTELVTKYGYRYEEHTITTEDSYILTTFRILSKCKNNHKLYPVLLVHGLFGSSDIWLVAGTEIGLGYVLAKNCYDVWAANLRGNEYSRRHMTLDPNKDVEYWNYSFDEHGNFDVPAIIDYITRVTGTPKIFFAGYSQGSTDFFAMASLRPEYNQKIQLSIQIGPVAWMTNSYSPVLRALAPNIRQVQEVLDEAGFREIFAKHQLSHLIAELFCHFALDVCSSILTITSGLEPGSIQRKVLKMAVGHFLNAVSTKSVAHYEQLMISTQFQRFDEGIVGNMIRYKARKPPEYNVSQITSPVVLICSKSDPISSAKDLETLISKLPNVVESYAVPVKKWTHLNYLWDEREKLYVNPKILEYLDQFNV